MNDYNEWMIERNKEISKIPDFYYLELLPPRNSVDLSISLSAADKSHSYIFI